MIVKNIDFYLSFLFARIIQKNHLKEIEKKYSSLKNKRKLSVTPIMMFLAIVVTKTDRLVILVILTSSLY